MPSERPLLPRADPSTIPTLLWPHLSAADAPLPAAAAWAVAGGPRTVADGIKGQEAPHTVPDETHLEKAQLGLRAWPLLTPHPTPIQSTGHLGNKEPVPGRPESPHRGQGTYSGARVSLRTGLG